MVVLGGDIVRPLKFVVACVAACRSPIIQTQALSSWETAPPLAIQGKLQPAAREEG
jgi:hypothetical protein